MGTKIVKGDPITTSSVALTKRTVAGMAEARGYPHATETSYWL